MRVLRELPLAGLGVMSEAVYLAAALRLPWWRYGSRLNSWRQILADGSTLPAPGAETAGFVICLAGIALLSIVYLLGWRLVRRGRGSRGLVWCGAGLFAATLYWLLPITADLHVYLSQSRLFTDIGQNPLLRAAGDLADPVLSAYRIRYAANPSVYGPVWLLLSAPGTLGQYDVAIGQAHLKALAAAGFLACAWLLERLLRRLRPEFALEGLYLFAWNPLVLLMAVGDGHNDIVMMAAALLGLGWLLEKRWALAFGGLALASWIKVAAAIFVPLGVWYAAMQSVASSTERLLWRRWEGLLRGLAAALAVSALVLLPFGWPTWILDWAGRLLQPANWRPSAGSFPGLALWIGLSVYAVLYGALGWRRVRHGVSQQSLLDDAFLVAMLAFVLGAARTQPWHLIWPAALAGLSHRRWAWPLVAALTVVLLAAQVWVEWGLPGVETISWRTG